MEDEAYMGVLDGKVAIVTGAGKGLGKYEALALAKEGSAVTVLARTLADVQRTAKEIQEVGGKALARSCDVTRENDVVESVAATVDAFGSVDILVNNAQWIPHPHPIQDWSEDDMRRCWETGPLGTWLLMKACYPYMRGRDTRIINTCTGAGHGYLAGYAGYGSAKEAIRSLTRSAAREWGAEEIRVNVISPSAMTPGAIQSMDEKTEAAIMEMFALKRWGDPEADIGRVVVFLAGPDSRHLTGNTISCDAGAAMVV